MLNAGALTPVERAKAGTALGKLGDLRPGMGVKVGLPDMDWVEIPPGPFVMGSKKGATPYADETPQYECNLLTVPFRISRYSVTVAQYQVFVEAGGHADAARNWWTTDGWKWKEERKVNRPGGLRPGIPDSEPCTRGRQLVSSRSVLPVALRENRTNHPPAE